MSPLIENHGPNLFENPELKAEINADNQAFEDEKTSATEEQTEATKKWVAESLWYAEFKNPDEIDTLRGPVLKNNDKLIKEIQNQYPKLEDQPFLPILSSLVQQNQISLETLDWVLEEIDTNGKFVWEDINTDESQVLRIKSILEQCNEARDPESLWGKKEFEESFPDIKKQIENNECSPIEAEVYSLIWRNFISITPDWIEGNPELDFNIAVETASNEILTNAQNIRRDTVCFERCMKSIQNGNTNEERFEWLLMLYTLAGTAEWAVWAKWSKQFQMMKLWVEQRKEILQRQYQETQELLTNNSTSEEEKIKNQSELELIIAEAWEIESWDIFPAWEIDKMSENLSENKELI